MSFVGGKLNLKGGAPLKPAGGVKKKKKKAASDADAGGAAGDGGNAASGSAKPASKLEGYVPPAPAEGEDRRTEAQKKRDEKTARLEEERLRKLAAKGYRDRVKDFNEHLASLSEHHDIPKVCRFGWAGLGCVALRVCRVLCVCV